MSFAISLSRASLGVDQVSNTADSAKPVSSATQTALDAKASAATLATHLSDAGNPHAVTKSQVGLPLANNTADADKPVSTAQQAAIDAAVAGLQTPPIVTGTSPTTGQTVSANTDKKEETLYITPAGTLLALTFSLPSAANSRAGQIIRGFISQIVTGLTVAVAGSGAVVGALPVTSAVNSSFAYQCVSTAGSGTWIRVY